jgi:hypothetical protein
MSVKHELLTASSLAWSGEIFVSHSVCWTNRDSPDQSTRGGGLEGAGLGVIRTLVSVQNKRLLSRFLTFIWGLSW